MQTVRQEVPTPQNFWQKVRLSLLQDVDDQDEDEDDDERQEADVDAQVVRLVEEGEAHHVAGKNDEHEDQIKDGEPPEKEEFF